MALNLQRPRLPREASIAPGIGFAYSGSMAASLLGSTRSRRLRSPLWSPVVACVLAACGTGSLSSPEPGDGKPADGVAVELSLPSADAAELADLQEQLAELSSLTATELVERHALSFTKLGYDPLEA